MKSFKNETIRVTNNDDWIDRDRPSGMKAAMAMIKAQCRGMKRIGAGYYGVVWGHPSMDVVYKVGNVEDNVGYLSFVKTLQRQKTHNPYTPKIYGLRYYSNGNKRDDVFVVAMERLKPGNCKKIAKWFDDNVNDDNTGTIADISFPELGIKMIIPAALNEFLSILKTAYYNARDLDYVDYDFHSGNFMMRDRQLVCIDPIA